MIEYRITKYNPANRVDGIYVVDEWTSYSDIGKQFSDGELTRKRYLAIEKAYIDCCIKLMEKAQISKLVVEEPECYIKGMELPAEIADAETVRHYIAACLREQCWMKLSSKDLFIHFGYEYYMYIGSALSPEMVVRIAAQCGLYCELYSSPYNVCEK